MLLDGPQRGLFLLFVGVGLFSMLLLDLGFAPNLFASGVPVTDAGVLDAAVAMPVREASAPAASVQVMIPAAARVPTIVARFESESKEPADPSGIRALARAMIEDHSATIVLEGHSDTRGGGDFNHEISVARAELVKARLVELGVSADRIETVGLGATRPLHSDDEGATSVNRRVEVRWIGR